MIGGGPVSWRSKKQTVSALSSYEAEYVASCSAEKEAVWLGRLLADMRGYEKPPCVRIYTDNQGSIDTVKIKRSASATSTSTYSITMSVTLLQQVRLSLFTAEPKR